MMMSRQLIDWLSSPAALLVGLGLATFLALSWALRGSPIGQRGEAEPGSAPSSGYRDRAVALAVVSLLLILAGAVVAGTVGIPPSLPVFAAGFGLNLWVARSNRRYRHVSPTLRRVVAFADVALAGSTLAGLLIVGNVFAFRYGGRPLDFTRDESFTLASLSRNQVMALERPLKFTLVLGRGERSGRARDRIRQLVDLYRAANPAMVSVEEIFAYSQAKAAEYDALLKRAPEVGVVPGDAIVIEYGASMVDRAVIAAADLFKASAPAPGREETSYSGTFTGEDAVTSAVARLREGRRARIGFTTGHGEPPLGEVDPRRPGLGLWRERLVSVGADPFEIDLVAADVPADIALIVVVASRARFDDREVARLRSFAERGGPMLVVTNGSARTGLEGLLALHNIAFDPGMVVDPASNAQGQANLVLTPPIRPGEHPITEALAGQRILLPGASPLRIVGSGAPRAGESAPAVNPGMVDAPFLRTGLSSWVESDLTAARPAFDAGVDRPGPVVVGIAASERPEVAGGKPRPRMVVLSSPFLPTNPYLDLDPSNLDLLMNACQWLRGKDDSLGVAPKLHTGSLLTADPNLRTRLHLVPTVLAGVLIVGFGVTTYLARRS